ncbi:MAG: LptF/LptG family permease, partial [Candidatus Omnitrophica bacterium]|nr:LptF/LptG family permease [Candidatus Omnitrophota bacterium]
EKYVLSNFIGAFFLCITLLIVLGVIGDILGFIDDIFKHNIPFASIFAFYFYLAPFAFVNMIPFACLLSAVYVFNSLSKTHEITAVIASGVSLWKLLRPVMLATFVLCLATFIINDKFVPSTMAKANQIRQEELECGDKKDKFLVKDIAVYGKDNKIIFARAYAPGTKTLENVIIHKQDQSNNTIEKISARYVRWIDGKNWMGKDVLVFKLSPNGNFIGEPKMFKEKRIEIREKPKDFVNNQWDPKFMSYAQLKKYLKVFNTSSSSTVRRLLVDLNYKLSFPFTAMITVLVGVPFSIETGRANALIGMARGITVAILFLPVMAICLALGKGGTLPPFLSAWLSNIIFAGIGIYYINKKS